MKELLMMLSMVSDEQMLFDRLVDAVEKYKTDKGEGAKRSLHFSALMLVTKLSTEGKTMEDVMGQMEKLDAANKLITPEKQ